MITNACLAVYVYFLNEQCNNLYHKHNMELKKITGTIFTNANQCQDDIIFSQKF